MAGLANGLVKIINSMTMTIVAELQAHSRSINQIVCHDTKNSFLSVSDDTMVNLWTCHFAKKESQPILQDITLTMSQRIPDQLLIGAQFGEQQNSVIIAPYDYKYFIHITL